MKYMGSKARLAKFICPILQSALIEGSTFVDLFAGGMNIVEHIKGDRIANDIHPYVCPLFEALLRGWKPPKRVTEKAWRNIRDHKENYSPQLVGYVGWNSYGGRWFEGYCRDSKGKRDYWREHYNNLMSQIPRLVGTVFKTLDYTKVVLPDSSLVYCDPPYVGTKRYSGTKNFDSDYFWDWAEKISIKHQVFVSEYQAPKGWKCVWEHEVNSSLTKDTGAKKSIERLFTRR